MAHCPFCQTKFSSSSYVHQHQKQTPSCLKLLKIQFASAVKSQKARRKQKLIDKETPAIVDGAVQQLEIPDIGITADSNFGQDLAAPVFEDSDKVDVDAVSPQRIVEVDDVDAPKQRQYWTQSLPAAYNAGASKGTGKTPFEKIRDEEILRGAEVLVVIIKGTVYPQVLDKGKGRVGVGTRLREYELSNDEWDLAAQLCNALKVFKDATLFFSREGTPNLATVIPAMDHIDEVLATNALDNAKFSRPLQAALAMGKNTLNRYYSKTDDSDIYRVVMILHPRHKLSYFQRAKWEDEWINDATKVVRRIFNNRYKGRFGAPQPTPHVMSTSGNRFDNLPSMLGPCQGDTRDELDRYLSTEPVYVADALAWWIERRDDYPCLSRMAIDFLTIP
ncbi:hypothetical protein H0H81_006120, partial [Sphagnurus paluster]